MRTTCLVLAVLSAVRAQDSYLETTRASCLRTSGFVDCAKYKMANFVHRIASTPRSMDLGPLRLVNIPRANSSIEEDESFIARAATYSPKEPEYLKMMKYGVRQANLFLTSHGVSMPLAGLGGGGPQLVYEDPFGTNKIAEARGIHSKKKFALLFPMMVLLKFGVVKALLIPILLGVLFIKKMIVLGVMALPSILSMLKACKIVPPYHPHAYHSEVYQPVMGVTGTDYSYHNPGVSSYGVQGNYDTYGKDWSSASQRRTRWGKATQHYEQPDSDQQTEQPISVPVEEQARSRNLHLIVPLMIMVKLMSIKALLIPTLLGVAAIKKFIILTVMILPSVIHKLKACKVVPHYVHYQPHHTHSHEFHDDYTPHHEHHSHHSDIHRRMGMYRSFRK